MLFWELSWFELSTCLYFQTIYGYRYALLRWDLLFSPFSYYQCRISHGRHNSDWKTKYCNGVLNSRAATWVAFRFVKIRRVKKCLLLLHTFIIASLDVLYDLILEFYNQFHRRMSRLLIWFVIYTLLQLQCKLRQLVQANPSQIIKNVVNLITIWLTD